MASIIVPFIINPFIGLIVMLANTTAVLYIIEIHITRIYLIEIYEPEGELNCESKGIMTSKINR